MRELEQKFGSRIAVVGIHSGKYTAERVSANISDAALRLNAAHPTLNDPQFRVWRSYAVQAWPTLVAVDPRGYVIGVHAGEFTAEALTPFVERTLAQHEAAGTLDVSPLHLAADAPVHAPTALRYPGKVAFQNGRLAIADSGNARVLVGHISDDGTSFHCDVCFDNGFTNPQGLVLDGDVLYVADAGAHEVLAIDLGTKHLRRVAGTGSQARTQDDVERGALSSPWDLVRIGGSLYVAMAGIHQLWRVDIATGSTTVHSGSGAEEIHDASHATAALAQPMGIAHDGDVLVFCDSESSAVREADVSIAGGVRTIVGTGLFDFGDIDGEGDAVRLQHPQGIVRLEDGRLLIADSYNGALKFIDRATRTCSTWITGLEEPAGLCASSTHVYVAETNAHRVLAIEIATGRREPVVIS